MALAIIIAALPVVSYYRIGSALQIETRTLSISTSLPSLSATHGLTFNFPSTASVGSIWLQYCQSPIEDIPCVQPTGLDASAATLGAQSGETGFSILSQNLNEIVLTRPSSATGLSLNSYSLNNVINPSVRGAFFLRISTYSSSDATGPKQDYGATAGSITQEISINTEVPPILEFCVGISIPGLCDTAEGDILHLGIFRPTGPSYGTTQFLAATNALFGYVVTVNGTTMTSGVNVITPNGAPIASAPGNSQFGLNLRANTVPAVGADISGSGAVPAPNYGQTNRYTFNDGDLVATSPSVANYQTFTVSYLVNINAGQAPGFYSTTLNYLCTATF